MGVAEDALARQKQHAQEVALAREAQRQATQVLSDGTVRGPTLSQSRQDVAQAGLQAEAERTRHEALMREVDKRIEDAQRKLRIVGPTVSGDYRSGWSVNAGLPNNQGVKQTGQMCINGTIFDVTFLLASTPVEA